MQTHDYYCRKANAFDDTKAIARYIHLTDPYIYPYICECPDDKYWSTFIDECTKIKGNIFNINNISVVLYKECIIGIACVIPCGEILNFTEQVKMPEILCHNLAYVNKGYFEPLINESQEYSGYNITNICIDKKHQGKGIGSLLMRHCIDEYGAKSLHLDVIASNEPAVRLYKSSGFWIVNKYLGFSGDNSDLLCFHMIRTKTE